jgi:ribosomal protein S18 acetylase RimI-like enzyme
MVRDATAEDAEALALVHATSWRETYTGLLRESVIANFAYERTLARWRERLPTTPPQAVLVWDDPPAGYVYCGREREGDPSYRGEVYAIYIPAARHGQGGGRALMSAAARRLAEAGMTSMLVWVLRENQSARAFYERLGGVFLREKPLGWPGSEDAVEVAYGWADTAALRSGAAG